MCFLYSGSIHRSNLTFNKFSLFIVEEEDGMARIGKIVFDAKALLGRGCEGTVVYRYSRKSTSTNHYVKVLMHRKFCYLLFCIF